MCSSIFHIYSRQETSDHVNYSDDTLYGKDALKRIVTQVGAQVKIDQRKATQQAEEIKEIAELVSVIDALKLEGQKVQDREKQELYDVRHAVTFVKHVSDLGLLAQRLFEEVLPKVKKRTYGFLWRDIGNATIKIWSEGDLALAKQFLRHPSFRRLDPKAQKDLATMLNKRFTEHFRSFIVQNARSEAQAREDFAYFYSQLPDLMITLLKRHYPSFDASMVYSK